MGQTGKGSYSSCFYILPMSTPWKLCGQCGLLSDSQNKWSFGEAEIAQTMLRGFCEGYG